MESVNIRKTITRFIKQLFNAIIHYIIIDITCEQ